MQSPDHAGRAQAAHEIDSQVSGQALRRRWSKIVVTTLIAAAAAAVFVDVVASRYAIESRAGRVPCVLLGMVAALIASIGSVLVTELMRSSKGRAAAGAREVPEKVVGPRRPTPDESDAEPLLDSAASASGPNPPRVVDGGSAVEKLPDPVLARVEPRSANSPSGDAPRGTGAGGVLAGTVSLWKKLGRPTEEAQGVDSKQAAHGIGARVGLAGEEDGADLAKGATRDTALSVPEVDPSGLDDLLDKIVAAHVPGRGLQIVASPLGKAASGSLIEIGRTLSVKGRTIIVDLNREPLALAILVDSEKGVGKIASMEGLAELLGGQSTFAEAIRRDQASRLHFIPTGARDADFRDFDLVLDALSETYDFIILLTPDVASSGIARIMAPYAEFVVLATRDSDAALVDEIEKDLIRGGAREVLVAGAPTYRSLEAA